MWIFVEPFLWVIAGLPRKGQGIQIYFELLQFWNLTINLIRNYKYDKDNESRYIPLKPSKTIQIGEYYWNTITIVDLPFLNAYCAFRKMSCSFTKPCKGQTTNSNFECTSHIYDYDMFMWRCTFLYYMKRYKIKYYVKIIDFSLLFTPS